MRTRSWMILFLGLSLVLTGALAFAGEQHSGGAAVPAATDGDEQRGTLIEQQPSPGNLKSDEIKDSETNRSNRNTCAWLHGQSCPSYGARTFCQHNQYEPDVCECGGSPLTWGCGYGW
ncbi:MAG: hypothetical protein AAF481_16610 [Acidobacteriota bacterium]